MVSKFDGSGVGVGRRVGLDVVDTVFVVFASTVGIVNVAGACVLCTVFVVVALGAAAVEWAGVVDSTIVVCSIVVGARAVAVVVIVSHKPTPVIEPLASLLIKSRDTSTPL